MPIKIVALALAGLGFGAGLWAARLWWRASAEQPKLSGRLDEWRDDQDIEWIVALLGVIQTSGALNGRAAMWTAVSVGFNAVSTLIGTCS